MDPRVLVHRLTEALPRDAVVVEEALVSGFPLLSLLPLRDAHGFYGLASGGIGFAMAGAIGVSLALRERPVVAMVGDGSAMYSIQALWTAAHLKRPITYVIANNRGYRILKERLKSMRGTERFIGMDLREPEIDFVALAQSMGVPARRIVDPADIGPALRAALAGAGPNLLDVRVADGFGG
jgi:benzoylformate decarboxylase